MSKGKDEVDAFHSREFENEARERLASMEAHHENLDDKVDDLSSGQEEILGALKTIDSEYVEDGSLEPLAEEVEKNAAARQRADAVAKYTVAILTLLGGFSGVILVIL